MYIYIVSYTLTHRAGINESSMNITEVSIRACVYDHGTPLLTWIDINPNMNKQLHPL